MEIETFDSRIKVITVGVSSLELGLGGCRPARGTCRTLFSAAAAVLGVSRRRRRVGILSVRPVRARLTGLVEGRLAITAD